MHVFSKQIFFLKTYFGYDYHLFSLGYHLLWLAPPFNSNQWTNPPKDIDIPPKICGVLCTYIFLLSGLLWSHILGPGHMDVSPYRRATR